MTCRQLTAFLHDYVAGTLPPRKRAAFEGHLADCPACIEYLRGYRETIRLAKDSTAVDDPQAPMPPELVDAIVAAAQVILALQTLSSREIDPQESIIAHIGTIHGGEWRNILADRVEMTGTVRISDQRARAGLRERIERIVSGITSALRCSYELTYRPVLAAVMNDPEATAMVGEVARQLHGPSGVYWMPMPRPTADWFVNTTTAYSVPASRRSASMAPGMTSTSSQDFT